MPKLPQDRKSRLISLVSLKLTSSRFKDFGLLILPETFISHFGEIPESWDNWETCQKH